MAFNRYSNWIQASKRLRMNLVCWILIVGSHAVFAAQTSPTAAGEVDAILKTAQQMFERGDARGALALVEKAVETNPSHPQALYFSARLNESLGQYDKAIAVFGALLKWQPNNASLYQLRGAAFFKVAKVAEAIADFDKEIELAPDREPYHWQRGIAYYYAGEFDRGRRQFESHRSVNANDVENAVWHFLCTARKDGVDKARTVLIPIARDGRNPMMEIHALFAGTAEPQTVLAAAESGSASSEELLQSQFYAHLYLGLYFEAVGDLKLAEQHILKAVNEFGVNHYMGDVARVHAKLRGYASKENK